MEIYTAGFAEWTAEGLFGALKENGIEHLIDVRLRPTSQLAGFAKQRDLRYFLERICNATYEHDVRLAPTTEMLNAYRSKKLSWIEYEGAFVELMRQRQIEKILTEGKLNKRAVLLCSEHTPEFCHRRLVIEHLSRTSDLALEVVHIV
jgi:uncharacterized protein (DUF488 family)